MAEHAHSIAFAVRSVYGRESVGDFSSSTRIEPGTPLHWKMSPATGAPGHPHKQHRMKAKQKRKISAGEFLVVQGLSPKLSLLRVHVSSVEELRILQVCIQSEQSKNKQQARIRTVAFQKGLSLLR